jgi:Mlc titration factor MtfA (ptsG expression regulator)
MIYVILALGLSIIAAIILWPRFKQHRRDAAIARPFPMQWDQALSRYWPLFSRIPYELQQKLRQHIKVFMAEKQIVAVQGLQLSEQERLIIAAQACLLIINKSFDHYDALKTILVYPSTFTTNRAMQREDGTVANDHRILSGESWDSGKIIISWDDTVFGLSNDHDGHNVVIHEFAHLLDHENGLANGAPFLDHKADYQNWSSVFNDAYTRMRRHLETGHPSVFDPYGASNPAEFFAVVSEMFFENGYRIAHHEPALYAQLKHYYGVDTAHW